jgi:hypothetical protein
MPDAPVGPSLRGLVFWVALAAFSAGLGWWGFGRLPKRVVAPVPASHWLTPYVRGDQSIDVEAALRDQRSRTGAPDRNLVRLLVDVLGPTAVSPDPSADLLAALGASPGASGHARLELPDMQPMTPGELQRIAKEAIAGRVLSAHNPTIFDALTAAAKKPWREEDLPTVAGWLDRQRPVLDSVVAWRPTHCSMPWVPGQNPSNAACLRLLPVRTLGQACAAEAFRAIARSDAAAAVSYAAALRRMGALIAGSDNFINTMIGSALLNYSYDVMASVLALPSLADADLLPWQDVDATQPWAPDLARGIDQGERLMIIEAVQGELRAKASAAEPTLVLNRINAVYDRLVAVARISSWRDQKSAWGRLDSTDLDLKTDRSYSGTVGLAKMVLIGPFVRRELGTNTTVNMALAVCVPNLLESSYTIRRISARLALIRAALTLRRNRDAGDLPADPFGDGPVKQCSVGPGWRIWSVGRDGIDQLGATKSDDMTLDLPAVP